MTAALGHAQAHLGLALRIIDAEVARLPPGAEADEARLLDRAVEALARAAETHDPARGSFETWAGVLVWQAVRRATATARRNAWRVVPLEETGPDLPDPRTEAAVAVLDSAGGEPRRPRMGALHRLIRARCRKVVRA